MILKDLVEAPFQIFAPIWTKDNYGMKAGLLQTSL